MASGHITSWQIDGETMKPLTDFIFGGGPKSLQMVTAAMNLRHLLLGRRAMTNLDSVLKSREITLPTKVHIVKAMVFPVVIHGCENWTIKKADHQRTDALEMWCWRRLLRVPWTARRSNKSTIKQINPVFSLKELMLKLKLQYFGHLMWTANSLEKTLMLRKIKGKGEGGGKGWEWLYSITDSMDMNLSELQEIEEDRGACCAAVHEVAKSQTQLNDWTTTETILMVVGNMSVEVFIIAWRLPEHRGHVVLWSPYNICQLQSTWWQRRDLLHSIALDWRRQWQPTLVLLPRKFHGRRSLVGCSPWGRKESDTTKRFHFSLSCIGEGNGNPFQCSCLENSRDGKAWWVAVYGVRHDWSNLAAAKSAA